MNYSYILNHEKNSMILDSRLIFFKWNHDERIFQRCNHLENGVCFLKNPMNRRQIFDELVENLNQEKIRWFKIHDWIFFKWNNDEWIIKLWNQHLNGVCFTFTQWINDIFLIDKSNILNQEKNSMILDSRLNFFKWNNDERIFQRCNQH